MLATKLVVLAFLATARARSIHLQDLSLQPFLSSDVANIVQDDFEDALSEHTFESVHPIYLNRIRRQLGVGSVSTSPDGSANLNLKVPLVRGESNLLSAVGSVSGIKWAEGNKAGVNPGYGTAGGGLALDNINGHSLSVTGQHIPGLGNQMTAAGRMGLINTDDHKLGANAFVTRTFSNLPNVPNYNTYGGGVDYLFRDKFGGSLGMSHTDHLQKTDYSAMANVNLFRNPSSSLDLNAGFSKSQSVFPAFNHGWRPQAGLSFTTYF